MGLRDSLLGPEVRSPEAGKHLQLRTLHSLVDPRASIMRWTVSTSHTHKGLSTGSIIHHRANQPATSIGQDPHWISERKRDKKDCPEKVEPSRLPDFVQRTDGINRERERESRRQDNKGFVGENLKRKFPLLMRSTCMIGSPLPALSIRSSASSC